VQKNIDPDIDFDPEIAPAARNVTLQGALRTNPHTASAPILTGDGDSVDISLVPF
jgi:hypothetical protein